MYQAEPDPYCYPDSEVLKNKPSLQTAEALPSVVLIAAAIKGGPKDEVVRGVVSESAHYPR